MAFNYFPKRFHRSNCVCTACFHWALLVLAILLLYQCTTSWLFITNRQAKVQYTSTFATKPASIAPLSPKKNAYSEDMRNFVCNDMTVVHELQRIQWMKAGHELFGEEFHLPMNDKDMGFYHETFGAMNVRLYANEKRLDSLLYHRIFKAGNDNIRSLLYEFAFVESGERGKFQLTNCPPDYCAHINVQRLYPKEMKQPNFLQRNRFSFTFVREPIQRFVSAYNEIESRAVGNVGRTDKLNFTSPLGSPYRFMEFIKTIVLSAGSGYLYHEYEVAEMTHIAPAIGTLMLAYEIDRKPLRLYQFENFGVEWKRLANESGVIALRDMYQERANRGEWYTHASRSDSYNITQNTLLFLSAAGNDAWRRYAGKVKTKKLDPQFVPANNFTYIRQEARKYLKVLCRLYLVDYLCMNYELPLECKPLLQEAKVGINKLQEFDRCAKKPESCKHLIS